MILNIFTSMGIFLQGNKGDSLVGNCISTGTREKPGQPDLIFSAEQPWRHGHSHGQIFCNIIVVAVRIT